MEKNDQNIEHILQHWPFDPFTVNVRLLELSAREILQMRIDMGILQLEIDGRPDGKRPHGATTYYHFLKKAALENSEEFELDEDKCIEIDREFVQFYHRRVCWLQLKEYERAVKDADHTLALMDFCKVHSRDEEWTISHEQYRPFVLYHRTQAAALAVLDSEDESTAGLAIREVNRGLDQMKDLFDEYQAAEQFDDDELVQRLIEFREGLRDRFNVTNTLEEQLATAIENEEYERAAELRDQISRRGVDNVDWGAPKTETESAERESEQDSDSP